MTDLLFFDHIGGNAAWLGAEDAKMLASVAASATTTAEGTPAQDSA